MGTEIVVVVFAVAGLVAVLTLTVIVVRRLPSDRSDPVVGRLDDFANRFSAEQGAVSERFEQLDRKLAAVQTSVDRREGAIDEQMGQIAGQVSGIVSLFNNDRTRGSWGELSLERIFEIAGLVEGRDYRNQFSEGEGRPDVVVFLPDDRTIVIDSKFPTARYLEAMAETDPEARQAALTRHGKELETIGKSLAKKHYADNATAGYVIVFVPSQAVYEAAAEAHPDVTDRLMQMGVVVAGPVSVFTLIKTAAVIMAEHRAIADARQIIGHVRELRSRLGTFTDHLDKVGRGLAAASKAYNGAVGSWNARLVPTVNRITDMSGADQLAHLDEVHEAIGTAVPDDLKEAV